MSQLQAWQDLFEQEQRLIKNDSDVVLREFVDKWKDKGLQYLELCYYPVDFSDGDYCGERVESLLAPDSRLLDTYSFHTLKDFVDYCEAAGGYEGITAVDEFDDLHNTNMCDSGLKYVNDNLNIMHKVNDESEPVAIADVDFYHNSKVNVLQRDMEFNKDLLTLSRAYELIHRGENCHKTIVKVMKNGELFVHSASYESY